MNENFRYEVKFVLNEVNHVIFRNWLNSKTFCIKNFPDRIINGLYFDDLDFSSVKDNLSGIPQRYKIRLRWYEDKFGTFSHPVLETKFKKGRLGKKDFISSNINSNDIEKLTINEINKKIKDSINKSRKIPAHKFYSPSLLTSYKREYYEDNNELRITIDNQISYALPINSKTTLELKKIYYNKRILELKFGKENKYYVSDLIRSLNLVPVRNSKYLTGLAMFGHLNYL